MDDRVDVAVPVSVTFVVRDTRGDLDTLGDPLTVEVNDPPVPLK